MTVRSSRGIPPLEDVCTQNGAHVGFRLRGEYLPGPAPFPESEEEVAWVARRETLVVTVLETRAGYRVLRRWSRGDQERSESVDVAREALAGFEQRAEENGAWSLARFAEIPSGPGHLEFEHEAYAYQEDETSSPPSSSADAGGASDAEDGAALALDLHGWEPPRRFRVERSRSSGDVAASLRLLGTYLPVLPEELGAESAFGAVFEGARTSAR